MAGLRMGIGEADERLVFPFSFRRKVLDLVLSDFCSHFPGGQVLRDLLAE